MILGTVVVTYDHNMMYQDLEMEIHNSRGEIWLENICKINRSNSVPGEVQSEI